MDTTQDITQREYQFSNDYLSEPINVILIPHLYHYNGTLAFVMVKSEKDSFLDNLKYFLKEGHMNEYKDFHQAITTNLEESKLLPMNIQFVDEHSLPGIGAWLEKNGIAKPTWVTGKKGEHTYTAYEFNLPEKMMKRVQERRMEIHPDVTRNVLRECTRHEILKFETQFMKCLTFEDLHHVWESMPDALQQAFPFPEKVSMDGSEPLSIEELEAKKFDVEIPEDLPAYNLQEAKERFKEWKDNHLPKDAPINERITEYGRVQTIGSTELVHMDPENNIRYSDPYLQIFFNEDGEFTGERFTVSNSKNQDVIVGPSLDVLENGNIIYTEDPERHLFKELTVEISPRSFFSPIGSLVQFDGSDQAHGHAFLNRNYLNAVDKCTQSFVKQFEHILVTDQIDSLNKQIHGIDNQDNSQSKSKGVRSGRT